MVTSIKTLLNNIAQRRELVKQYILLQQELTGTEQAYEETAQQSNLKAYDSKIILDTKIKDLKLKLLETRNMINHKFN